MKILAIGDMHLGRTPSRLPPELAEGARELGPAEAWRRAVDAAIKLDVKAVLLAGDLVEREEDFFEAYRELDQGVRRLAEANVEVIGVAGNHDVKALPRLAAEIPQFRLLGGDGGWEHVEITEGGQTLALWGVSFTRGQVRHSPLAGHSFERRPGINLGLLHCDRDAGASPYAPVTSAELNEAGLDGWLLGHIHKPDDLSAPSPMGYLGSLTGLDRSETGDHGPWLLTFADGQIAEVAQIPLAPLRWENLDVPLDGIAKVEETHSRLLAEVRRLDERLAVRLDEAEFDRAPHSGPAAVGLRVRFIGHTRFGADVLKAVEETAQGVIHDGGDGRRYFIARLDSDTLPEVDLQRLAERQDPPGLLARRLLLLDEDADHPERGELVAAMTRRLQDQSADPRWSGLDDANEDAAQWLRRAGRRALDDLLAQMPEGD